MKNKTIKASKNDGFAMAVVLMVMMVLAVFLASTFVLLNTNTKQIVAQEDNLKAYYLARSAIEIAYTALMDDQNGSPKIELYIDEKPGKLEDTLKLPSDVDPIGETFIEVTQNDVEVTITANAVLTDGTGSTKLSLSINKQDFSRIRWHKN